MSKEVKQQSSDMYKFESFSINSLYTNLPFSKFIFSTKFVLDSTFFHFNNNVYKQTFGMPMRSPLSPVVDDLILQRLESSILSNLMCINIHFITDMSTTLRFPYLCSNLMVYLKNSIHSTIDLNLPWRWEVKEID